MSVFKKVDFPKMVVFLTQEEQVRLNGIVVAPYACFLLCGEPHCTAESVLSLK